MRKLLFLLPAALAFGCQDAKTEPKAPAPAAPPAAHAAAPAAAPAAAAPAAVPAVAAAPEKPAGHAGCEGEAGGPVASPEATTYTDASGAQVTAAGAKLSGIPVVQVSELLAKPTEYAGKTVRLEGNVSAMCTHMRAWFSVQQDDRSGAWVRVLTRPAFLVPEGSIGKKVRTEGVVEVTELDPAHAQHIQDEHQLAGAAAGGKSVVVRATGAEFF